MKGRKKRRRKEQAIIVRNKEKWQKEEIKK